MTTIKEFIKKTNKKIKTVKKVILILQLITIKYICRDQEGTCNKTTGIQSI
jgi:hypothetical protein